MGDGCSRISNGAPHTASIDEGATETYREVDTAVIDHCGWDHKSAHQTLVMVAAASRYGMGKWAAARGLGYGPLPNAEWWHPCCHAMHDWGDWSCRAYHSSCIRPCPDCGGC